MLLLDPQLVKKQKPAPGQVAARLRKVKALLTAGATGAEVARKIGASEQTGPSLVPVYCWKKHEGGGTTLSRCRP